MGEKAKKEGDLNAVLEYFGVIYTVLISWSHGGGKRLQ